jgi:hypothetical protein
MIGGSAAVQFCVQAVLLFAASGRQLWLGRHDDARRRMTRARASASLRAAKPRNGTSEELSAPELECGGVDAAACGDGGEWLALEQPHHQRRLCLGRQLRHVGRHRARGDGGMGRHVVDRRSSMARTTSAVSVLTCSIASASGSGSRTARSP